MKLVLDATASGTGMHTRVRSRAASCKCGAPVVIVKRQERHTNEHLLHTQLYTALTYLDQFVTDEQTVYSTSRLTTLGVAANRSAEQSDDDGDGRRLESCAR